MNDRELMQQALDALTYSQGGNTWTGQQCRDSIEALRARLAQPEPPCKTGSQCVGGKCERCAEPEPVGYYYKGRFSTEKNAPGIGIYGMPVYTALPQREWVGLTDEDLSVCDDDGVILARYWEAKLKEKNGF